MSDNTNNQLSLDMAYSILLKEYQIPVLQDIPYDTYQKLSLTISKLKSKEYEDKENKIVSKIIEILSIISNLLLSLRVEKILNFNGSEKAFELHYSRITEEEKYILDGESQAKKRRDEIITVITNGQPKILEKISWKIKQKKILVRFIKPMEQFIGVDMSKYGPFGIEDITNLPFENAVSLINSKIAIEISPIID